MDKLQVDQWYAAVRSAFVHFVAARAHQSLLLSLAPPRAGEYTVRAVVRTTKLSSRASPPRFCHGWPGPGAVVDELGKRRRPQTIFFN